MVVIREWAEYYLGVGWVPIPVGYRAKAPIRDGWQETTTATVDLGDFEGRGNIGVVLGINSGGLVDVDLDCPEAVAMAPLFLPGTAVFGRPGNPRSHWLYVAACDSAVFRDPGRGKKATLLEIRSTGHQTVFPPSTHETGENIDWVDDAPPLMVEPSELTASVSRLAGATLLSRYWPDRGDGRHDARLALAGALVVDGWAPELVQALVEALPGDGDRDPVVESTLARIEAGEPIAGWPALEGIIEKRVLGRVRKWFGASSVGAGRGVAVDTDLANAKRLVAMFGEDLRYIPEWKKWVTWDGARWMNGPIVIRQRAEAVVAALYDDAEAATGRGDVELGKHLRKWARACSNDGSMESLIKSAQIQPGLQAAATEFDRAPYLLNCPNGTVDLRTGELREHRREDMITKRCPVEFDPEATSEAWEHYLSEALSGDEELILFVQAALGYSILGKPTRELMFIAHGQGYNGKSALLTNVLREVIGSDYNMTSGADIILEQGKNKPHPAQLAQLYGQRYVVVVEPDADQKLAEGLIKAISGKEKIRARRMYENFWEFYPSHVVWLFCNSLPRIHGGDHGIWRRIVTIPFRRQFDTIENFEEDMVAAEASGVLRWLVDGAVQAVKKFPSLPKACLEDKAEYREGEDRLAGFMLECTEADPDAVTEFSRIKNCYAGWCRDAHETPVSSTALGRMLTEKGFLSVQVGKGVRARRGFKLKGAINSILLATGR